MTDTQKPSWPDPTEWVNRLYQELAERQAVYNAEPDPLLKRNKAGSMLATLLGSLLELPAFKNDSVHLPLKDVLIFLADLDRGRDHPWAAPVNFGGTNVTTASKSELKIWVRGAFHILTESGFKPVEAYRHIADGLTASGRTGRKGNSVRWQQVQTWCREREMKRDEAIRQKLEAWWSDYQTSQQPASIANVNMNVQMKKQMAGHFADLCWSLPHLRDRSFSGESD